MYCSNCGTVASGNFCCMRGRPIRSPIEVFRKEERRRKNAFIRARNDRVYSGHIAEACWCAVVAKLNPHVCVDQFGQLHPDAYLKIKAFLSVNSGSSDGSGDGYGSGYGSGYGDGSVSGYGIKRFNRETVYRIDGVNTLIRSVRGNTAQGGTK